MNVDVTYFRIERIIRSGAECFLCALEEEIEKRYMDAYLSEFVMDAKARDKIVESRGFCNHHFYKILIIASKPESLDGHVIALIAQNVIEELIRDLHKQERKNEKRCPACVHLASFMEMYCKKIVELLSSNHEEFLKLFKDSKGLCIPHFTALINTLRETLPNQSGEVIDTLIEIEERNLQRLNSELAEHVRRQSYEFSDRDRAAVEDVLLRSVQRIVGRRGLSLHNSSPTL